MFGIVLEGKTRIVAKFRRTDLVICSHSREGITPSYSRINMVHLWFLLVAGETKLTSLLFSGR